MIFMMRRIKELGNVFVAAIGVMMYIFSIVALTSLFERIFLFFAFMVFMNVWIVKEESKVIAESSLAMQKDLNNIFLHLQATKTMPAKRLVGDDKNRRL